MRAEKGKNLHTAYIRNEFRPADTVEQDTVSPSTEGASVSSEGRCVDGSGMLSSFSFTFCVDKSFGREFECVQRGT